ncbi:MAG: SAM-dependent methyltransferase [Micromonosporaceae bacterium]
MTSPEPLTGVGKTALGVARVRAWESSRPDRLFNDPYAAAFIDAFPGAIPDDQAARGRLSSLGAALAFHAVIRTRFYDEYLVGACASGCRQIVLLAAGLDTRAYRLEWPHGVRLFEVDLAEVLRFKDSVLGGLGAAARCARTVVPADVRTGWPGELVSAGFSPNEPTAWLAEGRLIQRPQLGPEAAAGPRAAADPEAAACPEAAAFADTRRRPNPGAPPTRQSVCCPAKRTPMGHQGSHMNIGEPSVFTCPRTVIRARDLCTVTQARWPAVTRAR